MSSGFLLVETVPGREGHVLDALGRMPGVTHGHVIYPSAIALKVESSTDGLAPLVRDLAQVDGVVATRLYRAKNT